MTDLLPLSIGIGLVISLLFSELFGLAAGGMVVPGYIALHLNAPLDVIMTLMAAFATFAVIHLLSSIIIVYGRRRTVLMILVGYLIGAGIRYWIGDFSEVLAGVDYSLIGYIIPGLIAIWMDRQGSVETISSLITASVVVRLVLVLSVGKELLL
ncbi:MAG: poly-gamma-glutamate biosynthesis protein PgsC [Planctomycetota bacterium]|nr:MAG: poly-gamma-glutamate biosynthesis protein PgsC [Planctomycetota bacterium]